MSPRTADELIAGLDHIRAAPHSAGVLSLIVRRPAEDQREVLEVGELHPECGLVGDNWSARPSSRTPDGSPHPDMQLNIMSTRVVALLAGDDGAWELAGDQLYVDLDLSSDNLPPRTRLHIGGAVVEVTDQPHRGCAKFTQRFGLEAHRFVNSEIGRELNLRGINARVIIGGLVRRGDMVDVIRVTDG
ncbi:MAG: MOSC domain-containing protein [Acidimicrobiia bacterium]